LNPNGTVKAQTSGTHSARLSTGALTATGTYKVQISNGGTSTTAAAFTLQLGFQTNQPYVMPNGTQGGGVMFSSVSNSGTVVQANTDIWNYYADKSGTGTSMSFTVSDSGGGAAPRINIYRPDGALAATAGGGASPTTTTVSPVPQKGTYHIQIGDNTTNTTSNESYTVQAKDETTSPPIASKPDASTCNIEQETAAGDQNASANSAIYGYEHIVSSDFSPTEQIMQSLHAAEDDNIGLSQKTDPINVATGNLCDQKTDYTTAGLNPLSLTRYYHSYGFQRNLYPTLLGVNWRTNYDRYLRIISFTQVTAERPDGRTINFRCNVSTKSCTPDTDEDYSLTYSGSHAATWTLTDPDDTVETYTNSSGKGTLSTIVARNGYTQTMNYTSGQLTSVSDSYSRSLSLTYTSGVVTGVTTPDSLTLTYGYTTTAGQSLLTSVSYNTSPTTKITYLYENSGLPFALTGITDENGHRYATWAYDALGNATSSALGGLGANQTQITFVSTGSNKVTGPLGIVDTYTFTTLNNMPKLTGISRAANGTVTSATSTIRYDSNGYRNSLTDWNGNNTSWTNNSHGLPSAVTFASSSTNAQTINLTYDLTWPRLPHTISTNGVNANLTYDSSGNMLTRKLTDTTSQSVPYSTNGTSRTWTYTYNGTGQLLTAQLPRLDVTAKTTYGYTSGTLTSITDALSHVTTINTAQAGGLPTKITDPNGIHTTLSYTTRNWLSSSVIATSAGNLTTSYTYDSAGELTKATLPDNSFLSYGYDNAHRVTSITNALSESANITYDSAGNVTQTLWKDSGGTTKRKHTATFDALGRMLTDVGGASQTTSYTYDKNSNVQKITDALSHVTYISSDQLDRPYRTEDGALNISTISYDSHSRPLTVTDPKTNATTYVYDGFGEKIQQKSPDSLKTIYYYDADYNVNGINQSGINYSSATYDALDRLLTRTYSNDSSLNISLTYDETSAGHGFGVGHLTSGTDATGSLSRGYDERGNMTTDARTIASQLYSTSYAYESAGRLSSITYASSGWVIGYGRDSAGQIKYVSATRPGHSAVNLASNITHMPFGPASSWTYGNGVTDTRTFDQDYRITSITDHGTSNIQYNSYGYDADNNVTSITDNVTSANNQTLTYDQIDQLKSATGVYGTISSITYDSNSNRKTYGATTYTTPGLNDRMSVAGGSNITYISTGNVSAVGTNSMTYNQANQLKTAAVSGTTSTYTYDFLGVRNKIKTGTTPFQITQYDQWGELLTETSAAATPVETDYAYFDGMPVAAIQPGAATISALHTDNLGTVLRGTDSTKTVVYTANYNPNGGVTPTTTITMTLRYPGQHADSTGYYYNLARYYDPTTGVRYGQVDPSGIAAGLNPYVYGDNNPYANIDPFGLDWVYFQSSGTLAHYNTVFNYLGTGNNSNSACLCSTQGSESSVSPPSGPMSVPGGLAPDFVASGYSGRGPGLNNSSMQDVPNFGPINQGGYSIGPQDDYKLGNGKTVYRALPLTPDPATAWNMKYVYNRTGGYYFHGGTLSEGCIITKPAIRDVIGGNSDTPHINDKRLIVEP
jgi:RHS repeat-associated protein